MEYLSDKMILGALFAISTLSLFLLREIFKPIDTRWTGFGRRWKMPPGPPGQPVVGNLLQMFRARDKGQFGSYVS